MSQFEAALDDYRRSYPRLTVRDKITGTGRRIITEKGPDGVTHKCAVHENRNSEARFRLRKKYKQRNHQKHFDVLDIIERLLRDGIPAVMLFDDDRTAILYNSPGVIDPSKQHKLIKIKHNECGSYLIFESVSKTGFKKTRNRITKSPVI